METNGEKEYRIYLALGLVLAITVAAFFSRLSNSWVNYDDDRLVRNNVLIRELSWKNLKGMLVPTGYERYLVTLVYITYAFDRALWQDEAFGYHLTSAGLYHDRMPHRDQRGY